MRNLWLSILLLTLPIANVFGAEVQIGDPNTGEHAAVEARGTVGALAVEVVDGSGNQVTSFGGSGGTSHGDDSAFSVGSASSTTPVGYFADETSPDSVDEGDIGVPRMTLTRKTYSVISDDDSENNAEVDASGHLQIDIAADSAGIGGGTQHAVDSALGAAETGTLTIFKRDDALGGLTPIEGDAVEGRVDANGAIWTHDDALDAALSGNELQVDLVGITPDLMLGTDFSAVLGSASLILATQADNVANTSDGVQTSSFLYVFDGSTWDRLLGDATNGALVNLGSNNDVALSATDNAVLDDIVDGTLQVQVSGDALTALQLIDDMISGAEAQVDVVAALPTGTNTIGAVNHPTTGLADGVKAVTTAGTDEALAGSTTCKWVTVQAQTDNTGLIAVGATGVDATEATGTGVILFPGDTYTIETDNLADVFVDSTVDGEGVRFTYGT